MKKDSRLEVESGSRGVSHCTMSLPAAEETGGNSSPEGEGTKKALNQSSVRDQSVSKTNQEENQRPYIHQDRKQNNVCVAAVSHKVEFFPKWILVG